jgi:hypothetical protein
MAKIMASSKGVLEQRKALRRGNQQAYIAVLQNERYLFRFEQGIDWHEHGARRRRAKAGDHSLAALLQVDGDPFCARHAQSQQAGRELLYTVVQFCVGDRFGTVRERNGVGIAFGT